MVNCLNVAYSQPDVLKYGWKLKDNVPMPIWYEGNNYQALKSMLVYLFGSETNNVYVNLK